MSLPVLLQRPQVVYKERDIVSSKNDVLVLTANHIVEFFQELSTKPVNQTFTQWLTDILYKRNRILYLGFALLVFSLLLLIVSN